MRASMTAVLETVVAANTGRITLLLGGIVVFVVVTVARRFRRWLITRTAVALSRQFRSSYRLP